MKLLTDENIGLEVVEFLRSKRHSVLSAIEGYQGYSDLKILKIAARDNRVIITSDTDFGELIFYHKLPHRGVILLRLRGESNLNKIKVLRKILTTYKDKIKNKFVVVTEDKVRIRPPIRDY